MVDISRRRFVMLFGAAVPSLWLPRTGLVPLPGEMMLSFAGVCSFCARTKDEVQAMAGVVGRAARICNECLGLCFDMLEYELARTPASPPSLPLPPPQIDRVMASLEDALERMRAGSGPLLDDAYASVLAAFKPDALRTTRNCSFCDQSEAKVAKLIAGPTDHICDGCIGAAGTLMPTLLR